jgi:hypothetical protein
MNRFLDLLYSRPTLIFSLPKNIPALAEAAKQAGADALKVHIHIHHEASGTHFGSLAEEKAALTEILALGLPTGIVVGAGEVMASREEMAELQAMGFEAFDAYAHYLPGWMFELSGMAKMLAVDDSYNAPALGRLEAAGMDILEAAVIPAKGYGEPLQPGDLAQYRALREAVKVPIVVPTQRKIRPEEVPDLFRDCRPNALMIGAIVTGVEPGSVAAAVAAFKDAFGRIAQA